MRAFLSIAFALCSLFVSAQALTGQVLDAENGQPVPFAGITLNDDRTGTTADSDGTFQIRYSGTAPLTHFYIRGFGYARQKVNVVSGKTHYIIRLAQESDELNEVDITAGENPLHKIIRRVIAHRDDNNPTELNAFTYQSYSKVVFSIAIDSALPDFDTNFVELDTVNGEVAIKADSVAEIDSTGFLLRQFQSQQHIFMMESVTERKYASPRDNERVIATRISGLKTPMFVLLSSEMQSFSFYDNYVKILGSERVSPIAPGAIGRYVYIPLDTLIGPRGDSTFVIKYFPVKGHRFLGLDGELYITNQNWAVSEVVARPTGQDILGEVVDTGSVFGVEIHQIYELRDGHWFPQELDMHFTQFTQDEFGVSTRDDVPDGTAVFVGFGKTKIKNVEINPELKASDLDRVSVRVENEAAERDEAFWYEYRGDSLSARELRTYEFMDSLGEATNLEGQLRWLMALTTGKVRWGYVDFNIDQLMRYNVYEGFRLGLGVQTSPKLSEHFSIGGKFGYGFKDHAWKYGYFGEVYLNKRSETTLYGGYDFDIYELGRTKFNLQRLTIFGDQDYRFFNIPTFEWNSDAYMGIRHRIWPNWRADLSFRRQNRFVLGDYYFHYTKDGENRLINGFNVGMARLEMEYAPHDRYIEGPFGLRPLETTYPRFRMAIEHSFDGLFDRSYPFTRVDVLAVHKIKRVYSGTTTFTFAGSHTEGDVPYSFLNGPDANGIGPLSASSFTNAVGSLRSFETMPFNTYATNTYGALDIRHSFEDRLFHIGNWAPTVDVMYRVAYGVLQNPESHIGFNLSGLEHVYHEAGLEINNIYEGLGIGFYQRFGAYYSGSYGDNVSLKLTYRTTLF